MERALASPTSHHISLNGLVTQIALQATIPGRACDCLQPHQHTHTCSVKDERKEHAQVAMQAPQFGKRMCLRTHTHTCSGKDKRKEHAQVALQAPQFGKRNCLPAIMATLTNALTKVKLHETHCILQEKNCTGSENNSRH